MSRVQLALNVEDLDEAVAFYSKLFNAEPAKVKDGYANFAVADPPLKLVLLENPGKGGTINHLGVEVETSERVHQEIARLSGEGLFTDEEIGTTCCFATQDKVWVTGPGGEKWEVYTVLADSETTATHKGANPHCSVVHIPHGSAPRTLIAQSRCNPRLGAQIQMDFLSGTVLGRGSSASQSARFTRAGRFVCSAHRCFEGASG